MRKDIVIGVISALFVIMTISKCQRDVDYKRSLKDNIKLQNEYLALLNSKQRIDTLYVEGETKYVHKTHFKAITDTFLVEVKDTLKIYYDTLKTPEIDLKAKIIAKDLYSIDYQFKPQIMTIYERSVVNDTIYQRKYKSSLNGVVLLGNSIITVGLHYQNKNRWGVMANYNIMYQKQFYTFGASYRLF